MYQVLRKIHLYSAFVLLVFIIMYTFTGYVIQNPWFDGSTEPVKSTFTRPLAYRDAPDSIALSLYLQNEFGLNGWRGEPKRQKDGGWKFIYIHPGTTYDAVVSQAMDSVAITKTTQGFRGVMANLHRIHQYGHGFLYDVWMIFYDLTALALIVFPLTGVFLWHQLTKKRLLGWIFIFISFSFTTGSILYLFIAP